MAFLFSIAGLGYAHENHSDTPQCCCEPDSNATGNSEISLSEGNFHDAIPITVVRSDFGATIDLSLTYNSKNADPKRGSKNFGMGFGWTHSYNIFLHNIGTSMYRMDGNGRRTGFTRTATGSYQTQTGYFEELSKNPDGTFTILEKNGTEYDFAQIPKTPFSYDEVWRLIRITDRNDNVTSLSYADGLLTRITDTYGRTVALGYDPAGRLASVKDPLGRVTTFGYAGAGKQLMSITDPLGKTKAFAYDHLDQIIRKTDRDGRVFVYDYVFRRPVAIKDGAGGAYFKLSNTSNWAYDRTVPRGNPVVYTPSTTTKTDGRGQTWKYSYDANGKITDVTAPDGTKKRYIYDAGTLLMGTQTDANGNATKSSFDAMGNPIKKVDALGNVTLMTYEPVFNMMTSMTDSNGRITRYAYDARGNRVSETDALNQVRRWTYDARGNVLTETDKRGKVTRHNYDALGNRTKTTDALANIFRMTYDAVGNRLTRLDANGRQTSYQYDALNRLVRETDPLGKVTQTFYDGEGNRLEIVDRNGRSTKSVYDLRKRLFRTTDALGQSESQTYDGNSNRISITDKSGRTTRYEYDAQNRLVRTTNALGFTTSMTYDGVGNVLTETDPNGNSARYSYDALNRRVTKTDAIGAVTRYGYDSAGEPGCPECGPTVGKSVISKITDGNGKITYFYYDALYRLLDVIRKEGDTADVPDASDALTERFYDRNGNIEAITEPNGNTTDYEYDALNRRIKQTNAAGDVTRWSYDGVGNMITITQPNGNVVTFSYDARDRLTEVRDLVGLVARYTYDMEANRLSETDGNGNTTRFAYDPIYRVTRVTDPMGQATQSQFDPVGNVLKVTDREGRATTHAYDALNRRTSTTDALPATTRYGYDRVGNLLAITDAKGQTTSYVYDAVNRRTRETYPDAAPNTRKFTYDFAGNMLTRTDQKGQVTRYLYNDLYFLLKRDYPVASDDEFTYDTSGRMLSAEKGGWMVTFVYDGANRIIRTTQGGRTIRYTYNIPGRQRTITYPGGRIVTEVTDLRARLETVNDGPGPVFPRPIALFNYDLGNRVLNRSYRNGVVATYGYNPNNWITSLKHGKDAALIAGFGYDFDREGNKKFEQNLGQPAASQGYGYDADYRLVDFGVGQLSGARIPSPVTKTKWNLDPVGNWASKLTDGVTETRSHNAANEITNIQIGAGPIVAVSHDNTGNLVNDGKSTYSYDEENRLIQATRLSTLAGDPRVVGQYRYDALGRRVRKLASPLGGVTETRYFHDGARIIEEQDAAKTTLATYTYGNYIDEVLTMNRAGQTFYYHQNSLWSVEAVTDAAANVVERYAYDAYGVPKIMNAAGAPVLSNSWGTAHSAIGNQWMFTGRQFEEETGLYYYRARYYSAGHGRFLQRDPLGDMRRPNLFAYASGDPANVIDPSGLAWLKQNCVAVGYSLSASAYALLGGSIDLSVKGTLCDCCNDETGEVRGNDYYDITGSASGSIGIGLGGKVLTVELLLKGPQITVSQSLSLTKECAAKCPELSQTYIDIAANIGGSFGAEYGIGIEGSYNLNYGVKAGIAVGCRYVKFFATGYASAGGEIKLSAFGWFVSKPFALEDKSSSWEPTLSW